MRGAPGTEVTLDVLRARQRGAAAFRVDAQPRSTSRRCTSEYLGNGLAYLRLSSFAESTAARSRAGGARLDGRSRARRAARLGARSAQQPGRLARLGRAASPTRSSPSGIIVSGTGRIRQAQFEQIGRRRRRARERADGRARQLGLGVGLGDRRRRAAGSWPRAHRRRDAPTAKAPCKPSCRSAKAAPSSSRRRAI